MLVRAKIIDVELRTHKGKTVADVTIKFSEPAQAVVITLWNNAIERSEHKPFAEAVGQDVMIAVTPRIWNNEIQYNLLSSIAPRPYQEPTAPVRQVANK